MRKTLKKKDVIRLSKHFDFSYDVWDNMRKGNKIILGKKFIFVREDFINDSGIYSYDEDFDVSIIDILTIETGHKEIFKYCFYQFCGDYNNKFELGLKNQILMYEFRTKDKLQLNETN